VRVEITAKLDSAAAPKRCSSADGDCASGGPIYRRQEIGRMLVSRKAHGQPPRLGAIGGWFGASRFPSFRPTLTLPRERERVGRWRVAT